MQSSMKTLIAHFPGLRVLMLVVLLGLVTGCGGNITQPPVTSIAPLGGNIAFESSRALDGSDTVPPNGTGNIWVIKADGSGATP